MWKGTNAHPQYKSEYQLQIIFTWIFASLRTNLTWLCINPLSKKNRCRPPLPLRIISGTALSFPSDFGAFLPRDAMHSAAYAVMRCLSVCLSVRLSACPTRSWIVSKRAIMSSDYFHHHSSFTIPNGKAINYSDGDPTMGASNARRYEKITILFTNISLYLRNDAR